MDFLKPFLHYTIIPNRESNDEVQKFVCTDELNKKQAPVKVKKRVHFESKDLFQADESKKNSEKDGGVSSGVAVNGGKSAGIRVKILMTKEEAVRLLSKYKDGGILEFKDVANELARIPNNRVDVVSSGKKDK